MAIMQFRVAWQWHTVSTLCNRLDAAKNPITKAEVEEMIKSGRELGWPSADCSSGRIVSHGRIVVRITKAADLCFPFSWL
jgi:hypothetical protein